jgi:hypothetical protein
MRFAADNTIGLVAAGGTTWFTTAVYRDPSAWYHLVHVVDTTNSTATDRQRLYVNGVRVTSFGTQTTITQNVQTVQWGVNGSATNRIGTGGGSGTGNPFDGYLTEVNFIDGQALTASSFGEYSSYDGVWIPKKYSGTYGTNGFYLNFNDNSGTTATTLGKDGAGSNNWTPTNISVTAGVTYDSMYDVPTLRDNGVTGSGNYCVLNPVDAVVSGTSISEGNLYFLGATSYSWARGSIQLPSTGKWYFEGTPPSVGTNSHLIGIAASTCAIGSQLGTQTGTYLYGNGAKKFVDGTSTSYGATYTANDVIGVAFDADAGTVEMFKNGTSQGILATGITGTYTFAVSDEANTVQRGFYVNFGQRPFTHTPPTGYKALNTNNLPEPTIKKGGSYMGVVPFTATGANQAVTGMGFSPDFVWIKNRASWAGNRHTLYDSVRGAINRLDTSTTEAEAADNDLYAFDTDGFQGNLGGTTYVAWGWKAGGTATTNTSGTITSQISAGVTQGFSVVTYTGTGAAATVGHGLGVTPSMIICKNRDSTTLNWTTWFTGFTGTNYILLDTAQAKQTAATPWNSTVPTSTVFSVGADNGTNQSTKKQLAYCFAEVAGFSKFGSYTGNGSTDGPFVYCGFRPRFVLVKRSDASASWYIYDTSRDVYNVATGRLIPNSNASESSDINTLDILSNGFKLRDTTATWNTSSGTYIYAAFAEHPFKYSLAR